MMHNYDFNLDDMPESQLLQSDDTSLKSVSKLAQPSKRVLNNIMVYAHCYQQKLAGLDKDVEIRLYLN